VKNEFKDNGGWGNEPSNPPKDKMETIPNVKEEGGWGNDTGGGKDNGKLSLNIF